MGRGKLIRVSPYLVHQFLRLSCERPSYFVDEFLLDFWTPKVPLYFVIGWADSDAWLASSVFLDITVSMHIEKNCMMENDRIRPCLEEFESHALSTTHIDPINCILANFPLLLVCSKPWPG